MQPLFSADIFSDARPRFSPASGDARERVLRVALAHYSDALNGITEIHQFGGNEINSNNFKVKTGRGFFLLKRFGSKANPSVVTQQLALAEWLRGSHRVLVPRVVRDESGNLVVLDDGINWCLLEFKEGLFFSGVRAELVPTALEIGRLQRALNVAPESLRVPRKWDYGSADDRSVFMEAYAERAKWRGYFGDPLADALARRWRALARLEGELIASAPDMESLPVHVCHCDLHPHNILVDHGNPSAFIDVESFTTMPVVVAIAFAAFKLVRQHAVTESISESRITELVGAAKDFVEMAGEGLDSVTFDRCRLMASAEVFRRLLVILRLNVRAHDPSWNHVLPMHLAGLAEIDLMFRQH